MFDNARLPVEVGFTIRRLQLLRILPSSVESIVASRRSPRLNWCIAATCYPSPTCTSRYSRLHSSMPSAKVYLRTTGMCPWVTRDNYPIAQELLCASQPTLSHQTPRAERALRKLQKGGPKNADDINPAKTTSSMPGIGTCDSGSTIVAYDNLRTPQSARGRWGDQSSMTSAAESAVLDVVSTAL